MAVSPRRRIPPPRRRGLMEQRRETIKRLDAMGVKVTRVSGRVLLSHVDSADAEASVEIPFPVSFTEPPVFTFGAELLESLSPLAGSFPTMSAVVIGWNVIREIEGATTGYYQGATVATVTSGQVDQQIWLHYSFEGHALRNPITPGQTTDETI